MYPPIPAGLSREKHVARLSLKSQFGTPPADFHRNTEKWRRSGNVVFHVTFLPGGAGHGPSRQASEATVLQSSGGFTFNGPYRGVAK
jgi:hypothetical protein